MGHPLVLSPIPLLKYWTSPAYTLERLPRFGTTSCLATVVVPSDPEGFAHCIAACKWVWKRPKIN